jgi:F420-dependent oxidoreductase-like protein
MKLKIGTMLNYAQDFTGLAEEVVELEKAGLDVAWVPEAYSFDAASAMGYLAAKTDRITIASGILPIYSRTPTLLAMTAAGVDNLSGGRAMLGIGASGPQVIEGFHGVPYTAPVARIEEIVEICRKVWRREKLEFDGQHYHMPLTKEHGGGGLGKALKIINRPVRERIPIAIAALGPRSVRFAAAQAEAWLPAFYMAEGADAVWGESLRAGAAERDPALPPLEVYAGGTVAIGEGKEELREMARPHAALYVGGMGAREKNFYNQIFRKYGYEAEAERIQDLYLAGRKSEAEAAIPDDYLAKTSLCGPEGFVRDRISALVESGVTALNVSFAATTSEERVRECGRLRELVEAL